MSKSTSEELGGAANAESIASAESIATESAPESQERLAEAIFRGALDGIIVTDAEGRIVDANPCALEMVGAGREEIRGRSYADFTTIADGDFEAIWRDFLRHGSAEGETDIVRPDGERRRVEYHAVTHIASNPERHLVVFRDLSERRRREAEIARRHRLRSLSRLASGIATDFEELLAGVLAFADFVKAELPSDHPRQGALIDMVIASGRGYELVRQLLAFGRRLPLEPTFFGVGDLVADVARLTDPELPDQVELRIIPGSGEVYADRAALLEVLVCLVRNAQEAIENLGGHGVITLETTVIRLTAASSFRHTGLPAGSYAVITVRDTGVGMETAVRDRMFEPFYSTKEGAEGLGLAAAHGIVTQSGGQIEVETLPGSGTTVRVYLPAVRDSDPPRPMTPGDTGRFSLP